MRVLSKRGFVFYHFFLLFLDTHCLLIWWMGDGFNHFFRCNDYTFAHGTTSRTTGWRPNAEISKWWTKSVTSLLMRSKVSETAHQHHQKRDLHAIADELNTWRRYTERKKNWARARARERERESVMYLRCLYFIGNAIWAPASTKNIFRSPANR